MINVILQSLGLDLVNINVYANAYQNIPNGLWVMDICRWVSGDKIFTNCLGTNSFTNCPRAIIGNTPKFKIQLLRRSTFFWIVQCVISMIVIKRVCLANLRRRLLCEFIIWSDLYHYSHQHFRISPRKFMWNLYGLGERLLTEVVLMNKKAAMTIYGKIFLQT